MVSVPLLSLEQRFIAIVLNLFHIKFRVSESYVKYMVLFSILFAQISCIVVLGFSFYQYLKA